jgi:uncharacterized protein (TIGR03118 family)
MSCSGRLLEVCKVGLSLFAAANLLSAADGYLVHNLVSDIPGLADQLDKNLVNPWGNAFSPTSPFWIGNNGTGTSTLYDGTGTPVALVVSTPGPPPATASNPGAVTGVVWNGITTAFLIGQTGKAATFMFCTEDGTIEGWNAGATATILVDNSTSGAVYKGCALGGTSAAPLFYAANCNSGKVDVFDATLKPVTNAGQFVDSTIPAGFAPFSVAVLGGNVYVTYAKQDSQKHDDAAGPGNGYVTVFGLSGSLVTHLVAQGPLNSPWGLAIAPASFGGYAGALLVGNFGDGMINAFDPKTGKQLGFLTDSEGAPLVIPGLWSLEFGNGGRSDAATLYFTAGIPGPFGEPAESHGLFGSIQPSPVFQSTGVTNAAAASAALAPNSYVAITGGALSATSRTWNAGDFAGNKLPASLNGVSVTVNGEPAYVEFVSATQLDVLLPADLAPGPVQVQTTNNGLESATVTVNVQAVGPAFFTFTGNKYVAATHADGSLAAPAGLITGATSTPVKAGETMALYANGLGQTQPAVSNGQVLTAPLPLASTPLVTIGGASAKVVFSGLVSAGLYQINVVVPAGLTPGDNAIVLQAGGVPTQANAFVSVSQ